MFVGNKTKKLGLLGRMILCFLCQDIHSDTINRFWSIFTINGAEGRWLYQIQPQLRFSDKPVTFDQVTNALAFGYQFTKRFSFMLGQSSFYTTPRLSVSSRKEYRWYQEGQFTIKEADSFLFFSLSRLEEIDRINEKGKHYRLRQRFGINQNLTKSIVLVSYNELFISLNKPQWVLNNTFAENRFYLGINQKITKKLVLGLGYLNQLIFTHPERSGNVVVISLAWTPKNDKYGDEPIDEPN